MFGKVHHQTMSDKQNKQNLLRVGFEEVEVSLEGLTAKCQIHNKQCLIVLQGPLEVLV